MRLPFLYLLLITITSCTVTKRHFQPGWHVEWNKKSKITKEVTDFEAVVDSEDSVIFSSKVLSPTKDEATVNEEHSLQEINETNDLVEKPAVTIKSRLSNIPIKNMGSKVLFSKSSTFDRNNDVNEGDEKWNNKTKLILIIIGVILLSICGLGVLWGASSVFNNMVIIIGIIGLFFLLIGFNYKEDRKEKKDQKDQKDKSVQAGFIYLFLVLTLLITSIGLTFIYGF